MRRGARVLDGALASVSPLALILEMLVLNQEAAGTTSIAYSSTVHFNEAFMECEIDCL